MKKFISVLLSLVMVLSVFSSAAFATDSDFVGDELSPAYSAGGILTSILSFSGKTATCTSSITMASDERWISITQTLEREVSTNSWQSVKNCGWTVTASGKSFYYVFENSGNVTESGTYRLKSVFLVESATGERERIAIYSPTKTVKI